MQYALTGFTSGVLSPRLSARLNPETFLTALQIGENFIITPQGGLLAREGREHIAITDQCRFFQFHRGGDKPDLMIQVSLSGEVRLYEKNTAAGRDLGTPFKTFTNLLIPDWRSDYTADAFLEGFYLHNTERQASLVHPWIPPYVIKEDSFDEYIGGHIDQDQVPDVEFNDEKSPNEAAIKSVYTVTIPGDWGPGDRYVVFYGGDIGSGGLDDGAFFFPIWQLDGAFNAIAILNALKATIFLSTNESLVSVTDITSGGTCTITITGKNAGRELSIESRSNKESPTITQDAVTTDTLEPAWSFGNVVSNKPGAAAGDPDPDDPTGWRYYRCKVPHWSGDDVAPVTPPVEGEPGQPGVPGKTTTEPGVGTDWEDYWEDLGPTPPGWYEWQYFKRSFNAAGDPSITPPHYWNTWNNRLNTTGQTPQVYAPWDRGFPGVAVYFQQRMILMGTEDAPTSIWGSRVGDYGDWQPGVNDADPFYFDLDTSDSPRIKWSEPSQSALIIGTSAGDFRLGGQITLGPADITLTKQNSSRSYKTRAITMNNTAFYIEQGREKVRGTVYGEQRNAWTSMEYSTIAENLFSGKVNRVVLTQSPEAVAYILRDDGNLIQMFWMPSGDYYQPIFTEMTCDGAILDICAYYDTETEEDCLLLLTRYGETEYRTECLPYPERNVQARNTETDPTLAQQGIAHLDSWVTTTVSGSQLPISNLLTGTVAVLFENAYLGEFEVIDGFVNLGEEYDGEVTYGRPYVARAKTFEVLSGNQRGAALGTVRRWNKIIVRLLDSALPKVNGTLPADRSPDKLMDIPDLVVEGLRDVVIRNLGQGDGALEIVQDRPYPTHIVALFGEVTVENA